MKRFETIILEQADKFIQSLDLKTIQKLFFVIRAAENKNDSKLFKKLNTNIWEFRVNYKSKQIRILAFWDKRKKNKTLVIATNGFFKKTQKTPKSEIKKADDIRKNYISIK